MNLLTRTKPFKAALVLTSVTCLLCMSWPDPAEARGAAVARAGGGGFSRSSAASGGNFNARSGNQSAAIGSAAGANAAIGSRSATGARSVSGARSTGGAGSAGGAGSVGGAGSAGGFGQPGDPSLAAVPRGEGRIADLPPKATTLPADDGNLQAYRQQFVAQNKDRWDDHVYVDDGTVVAARVVGTAAVVDAVDTADYVNTTVEPVYDTSMPCTIKSVASVGNVAYYRCETQWYRRGYQSGNVVYIPSDAPAGY